MANKEGAVQGPVIGSLVVIRRRTSSGAQSGEGRDLGLKVAYGTQAGTQPGLVKIWRVVTV
jgi:hypothetical protein